MLCRQCSLPARHFKQTVDALCFTPQQQVGRRVSYQLGKSLKICVALFYLTTLQKSFSQKQVRFADGLPITDVVGKFQRILRSRQRFGTAVHSEIAAAER